MPALSTHLSQYRQITSPLWPGLWLSAGLAGCAFLSRLIPGFTHVSPSIVAAGLGLLLAQSTKSASNLLPGLAFSSRHLLRVAVSLLGLQITFEQIAMLGWVPFALVAITLAASFLFVTALGSIIGVDAKLTQLIAAGTSVCGAAAVAATNAVTDAPDEDVAYAVAMVTLFGTALMLAEPLLYPFLSLNQVRYGLWAGASVHEVAQVVGATSQVGADAERIGTIAKLSRVILLAPLVTLIGVLGTAKGGAPRARTGIPLFVLAFVVLVLLGSMLLVPPAVRVASNQVSSFLLAMALAAMGLNTRFSRLNAKGWPPLILGASGCLFIALFSLALIRFFD